MRLAPGTLAAAAITPAIALAGGGFAAAKTCSPIGASRFDEDHVFTKTMRKSELVQQYYEGQGEVEFERHLNSEPGLEG
jgi:TRAP-type transport system periplasmic protein